MSFSVIYIYNFIISLILLIVCRIKKTTRYYLCIVTFYYIVIFGQRWFGGIDFHGYLEYYLEGKGRSLGYSFIQEIFRSNGIYFGVFILCIYAFTTLVSIWFFRKFTHSNLGIFLFFLSEYHIMSLNPLRTYIAINIFLIGIYYFELENKKIGFLIMLSGILFHYLAIGGIFVYFIFRLFMLLRLRKYINWILLFLPLINLKPLLYIITKMILPMYTNYFNSYFDQPLSILNRSRYYVIIILFLYLKKYLDIRKRKEKMILQGMYSFLLLMGMATHFGELHRIAYFNKIFEPLFFIYLLEKKKVKIYLKIIIIVVLLLNYLGIIYMDMGTLRYMEVKRINIFDQKNKDEYYKEISNYLQKWGT